VFQKNTSKGEKKVPVHLEKRDGTQREVGKGGSHPKGSSRGGPKKKDVRSRKKRGEFRERGHLTLKGLLGKGSLSF